MGRPSQPIISKDGAAAAALEIIDTEGLDKLSLQVLAKKLGVKAPSLYYHFKNKAELMAAITRSILREPVIVKADPSADWKAAMTELALSARNTLLRHPNAVPLLLEFYPRHVMLSTYDYWTQHYEVEPELKMVVLEGLEKLTFGSVMVGAISRTKGLNPIPEFDHAKLPALGSAVEANTRSEEELFVEAVSRFLSTF